MKSTLCHAREGSRHYQPYVTAGTGTAEDIHLHLSLLQTREDFYEGFCVPHTSLPTPTPKHLVDHLHRNHQTKLGSYWKTIVSSH